MYLQKTVPVSKKNWKIKLFFVCALKIRIGTDSDPYRTPVPKSHGSGTLLSKLQCSYPDFFHVDQDFYIKKLSKTIYYRIRLWICNLP
jgi:hypothetical protein